MFFFNYLFDTKTLCHFCTKPLNKNIYEKCNAISLNALKNQTVDLLYLSIDNKWSTLYAAREAFLLWQQLID